MLYHIVAVNYQLSFSRLWT